MISRNVYLAFTAVTALSFCSCKSVNTKTASTATPHPLTIYMVGDSTMANKPLSPAQPERGWGQMLPVYFKPDVRIENLAANGRSSKSFRDEGLWNPALKNLQPGDYVIIQFGHNDEKPDEKRHTDAFSSYKASLERYIRETRELKGKPILATSVARRAFTNGTELVDTHGDYITAARQVAKEQNVPLLDLQKDTAALLSKLGPELSKKMYMWVAEGEYDSIKEKREDNTHFNAYGASRVCDLATEEMKTAVPELAKYLKVNR